MDHASLMSLVAELLTTIHLLAGYPAAPVQPEIYRVPQAVLAERVCHKPCGVRAYYQRDEGVYLDETLDVRSDLFDRSILLHELVHHMQAVSGRFDTMASECDRWNSAEREAYALQNQYLGEVQSTRRVSMPGLVATCDSPDRMARK